MVSKIFWGIFLLFFIVVITATPVIWRYVTATALIELNRDKELVFKGYLNEKNALSLFAFYEQLSEKPDTLHITSSGGQGFVGGMIGDWVHTNKLNVKVSKRCLSACANFIFPAGVESQLTKEAVISWHGSYTSTLLKYKELGLISQERLKGIGKSGEYERLLEFVNSYYRKIGVDPNLPIHGEHEDYSELNNGLRYDGLYEGFYYSVEDMIKMGINVKLVDGTWDGNDPKNKRFENYYLATIKR